MWFVVLNLKRFKEVIHNKYEPFELYNTLDSIYSYNINKFSNLDFEFDKILVGHITARTMLGKFIDNFLKKICENPTIKTAINEKIARYEKELKKRTLLSSEQKFNIIQMYGEYPTSMIAKKVGATTGQIHHLIAKARKILSSQKRSGIKDWDTKLDLLEHAVPRIVFRKHGAESYHKIPDLTPAKHILKSLHII